MQFFRPLLVATCCLAAASVQAAGFSLIKIPADTEGPTLQGALWYPCDAPASQVKVGRLVMPGVKDCQVTGVHRPLIVISHGSAGSFLGHHDTAETLADAGFVVAAISHPGDNFQDLSRQGDLSIFSTRPVDMRRLVNYIIEQWPGRSSLDPDKIGLFGFSRGGYTGLVAAGAIPDFQKGLLLCKQIPDMPMCGQIQRNELPKMPWIHDSRIRALVIADPFNLFTADGLKKIAIPVQLWASARGGDGVTPESVESVRRNLPTAPDYHVAANSGHFGYLAPCPAALIETLPEICRDTPTFDRVAFHAVFNAKVLAFFRMNLHWPDKG